MSSFNAKIWGCGWFYVVFNPPTARGQCSNLSSVIWLFILLVETQRTWPMKHDIASLTALSQYIESELLYRDTYRIAGFANKQVYRVSCDVSAVVLEMNTCFCPMCLSREHLIRLQHENKMLKLAQEGSDNEKIALLQSLLEDANRRKSELETENRSAVCLIGRSLTGMWIDRRLPLCILQFVHWSVPLYSGWSISGWWRNRVRSRSCRGLCRRRVPKRMMWVLNALVQ